MESIIFATNNQHKVDELKTVVNGLYHIMSLKEAGIDIDIPEPFDTLEENAKTKADTIFKITGTNCFSEDTGLEVLALKGSPGVHSARYASLEDPFNSNIEKLLAKMEGIIDRSARFRTIIYLLHNGMPHIFEGVCEGSITCTEMGKGGFGYDAVFEPIGANVTFAQMSITQKNVFSHRAKATALLIDFLSTIRK